MDAEDKMEGICLWQREDFGKLTQEVVMRTFCIRFVVFLWIGLCFFACSSEKNGWKGTIRDENGVVVVENPRIPLYETAGAVIEEDLSIGGDEENHSLFYSVGDIDVDEKGRIYVLDAGEKNIKIFDPDGNWIQTVGGPGQGPGELNQPISIACAEGKMIVQDGVFGGKLVFFDAQGRYADSVLLGGGWTYKLKTDFLDHYLMISMQMGEDQVSYVCIGFYDDRMELVWEVDRIPRIIQSGSFELFSPTPWFDFDPSGYIVYAYPSDYEIRFFKSDGTLIRKIRRDYNPVAISDEAKEKKLKSMKVVSQLKLDFSRHYPAFQRFLTDDEGRLFVRTWELVEGQYLYDVFDSKGRYTYQLPLPDGLKCIKQGMLYCIDEDEEGFQSVKRCRLGVMVD